MSLDILDILFKLDYFVCLLIGFPLNILLIILIIFKTPKEMKTHSRILIQNCVLDILMLTVQMFLQVAFVPFINQAGISFLAINLKTTNNTTNIIRILIFVSFHLIPVFNPIICILTVFVLYLNYLYF
uniref:Uncharacterized protein n=1 Tax=Meloidogyne enterolobii TaxID=390850 RepID=A0A6V7UR26_MELEN|nr:unnamed protein product [Meloidogyne enterolobii]